MISKDELKKTVKQLLCDELQMEPEELDENATFIELAVDSIAAVQFVKALRAELGGKMTMQAIELYEHSTINKLTDHLFTMMVNP